MLNIISNNVFINKLQYGKTTPSFKCSCCCDEFVKTQKQKGNEMTKKMDSNYNAADDMKGVIESFSEKKSKLPLCFDMVLGSTMGYLNNNLDAKKYSEIFTSEASFVFQTEQYGVDKENFSEKYSQEVALVKNLNSLCNALKNSECSTSDFNSQVNSLIKAYTQS